MSDVAPGKGKRTATGIVIDGMYNNLPYTGPALNLKNDDPPQMLPRLTHELTVRTFDMSNPSDADDYKQIMHEVGLGWSQISKEEMEWIPRIENWKIFLRILHLKYIQPEDLTRVKKD